MRWPFSRPSVTRQQEFREFLAETELQADHKGAQLDRCETDVQRRALCLKWAGEARTAWYEGRKRHIAAIIASQSDRYRQYSPEARRMIGDQQWSRSVEQKDLASAEQMYSRWAQSYAGGPGAKES